MLTLFQSVWGGAWIPEKIPGGVGARPETVLSGKNQDANELNNGHKDKYTAKKNSSSDTQ